MIVARFIWGSCATRKLALYEWADPLELPE
jgi:hypothetical protein